MMIPIFFHPAEQLLFAFQLFCHLFLPLLAHLSPACPPATSETGARPLEGQLSLQINECLGAISFEKAFCIRLAGKDWKDFQSCFDSLSIIRIKMMTKKPLMHMTQMVTVTIILRFSRLCSKNLISSSMSNDSI
jgi:hypothetical protein